MTLKEQIDIINVQLDNIAGIRFPLTRVRPLIDEANQQASLRLGFNQHLLSATIQSDTIYFDITTINKDIFSLRGIYDGKKWLRRRSFLEISHNENTFETRIGTPSFYIVVSHTHIIFNPVPKGAVSLEFLVDLVPKKLFLNSEIDITRFNDSIITTYVMYRLLAEISEYQKATEYFNRFESLVSSFIPPQTELIDIIALRQRHM